MIITPKDLRILINVILSFGLISSLFYLVIFALYYEDIGVLEVHGKDTNSNGDLVSLNDLPLGLLLSIEIIASIVSVLGSLAFMLGLKNKNTRYAITIIMFFVFAALASTLTYRGTMIWGNAEGQCNYFGSDSDGEYGDYEKACPTTRHTNLKPTGSGEFWKLEHVEPTLESDCIFWFWDNTFTLSSVSEEGNPNYISLQKEMIENMDWSQKHLYGFYGVDSDCTNTLGSTDCIPDGRTIPLTIQETNLGITIDKKLSNGTVPDISYCYYWGCSEVCNVDRYRVNRILLFGGIAMASLSFILFGCSVTFASGIPEGFDSSKKEMSEDLEAQNAEDMMKDWKPMTVKSAINRRRKLRF